MDQTIEQDGGINATSICGFGDNGEMLTVKLVRLTKGKAFVSILLRLSDGRILKYDSIANDETVVHDVVESDGLRIITIEPLVTYRILFSGRMQLVNSEIQGNTIYFLVNLKLWCRPLSDPADSSIDSHPSIIASAIANEKFNLKLLKTLYHNEFNNKQFGQMAEFRGKVEISRMLQGDEMVELFDWTCYGLRERQWASSRSLDSFDCYKFRFSDGNLVEITIKFSSHLNSLSHMVSGFLHRPNGRLFPISWTDLNLFKSNPSQLNEINFIAGGKNYTIHLRPIDDPIEQLELEHELKNWGRTLLECSLNYSINGFGQRDFMSNINELKCEKPLQQPLSHISKFQVPFSHDLSMCLALTEDACCVDTKTGGKAANLAILLANNNKEEQLYSVPKGFVLTVEAYNRHIAKAPELKNAIELLKRCDDSKLEKACAELVALFTHHSIDSDVRMEVENYYEAMFGDEICQLAVRSSAVGEDGSESSGAGQMETILGVKGKVQLFEAVKKCWASHFSFRAVEYRRQFGSKIDSPMAVLVQELVPADVAGVLFTRHPDNGSTAKMVVNANVGLGESVVSGHSDVDTITVYKTDGHGSLAIKYEHIRENEKTVRSTEHGLVEQEEEKQRLENIKLKKVCF